MLCRREEKWIRFHCIAFETQRTASFFFRFKMMSTSAMMFILALIPFGFLSSTGVAANLLPANTDGLKAQFQTALKSFSDVASLHYALGGLKQLGVASSDSLCNDVKRLTDKTNIESIYHGTEASKSLANCKVKDLFTFFSC